VQAAERIGNIVFVKEIICKQKDPEGNSTGAGFSQPPTGLEAGVQQFLAATNARLTRSSTHHVKERV
jgi:hypothetical protein